MAGLLALLFIALPIAEIYVILQVGDALGGWYTLALIIAMAVAGAWLARWQGAAALRELQNAMATGQAVGRTLVSSVLVLAAAVLMITPGFITDGIGLALLLPPVRALVAGRATRWVEARTVVMGPGPRWHRDDRDEPPPPGVIDI